MGEDLLGRFERGASTPVAGSGTKTAPSGKTPDLSPVVRAARIGGQGATYPAPLRQCQSRCGIPAGLPPTDYASRVPIFLCLVVESLNNIGPSCGVMNQHSSFPNLVYTEEDVPETMGGLQYLIALDAK